MSLPLSCVVDTWEKLAGDDGRSAAISYDLGHEALQHLLIIVVIAREGLQLTFQTYFYWQSQLRVPHTNEVTCTRKIREVVESQRCILIWFM